VSRYNMLHPNWKIPQLKEVEWGYIAGYLDGDGSIPKGLEDGKLRFRILFGGNDKNITIWLKKKLNLKYKIVEDKSNKGFLARTNPIWRLNITSNRIIYLILKRVSPYLIEKKKRANEAINYFEK